MLLSWNSGRPVLRRPVFFAAKILPDAKNCAILPPYAHTEGRNATRGEVRRYVSEKRALDFILSLGGIVCLSWLLLALAAAIKLDSPGPVFFKQKRVGIHKTHFEIYKFRTMRSDTPHDMPTHLLTDPDRYITRVGRFLRRTSLDELPQLWNILKGDMPPRADRAGADPRPGRAGDPREGPPRRRVCGPYHPAGGHRLLFRDHRGGAAARRRGGGRHRRHPPRAGQGLILPAPSGILYKITTRHTDVR